MRRLSGKLTYANVISTLCLFLLLGGGAAVAASGLGKSSVGPKQLKKSSVTTAKLKNFAVTAAKLGDSAVNAGKLRDGAVNGAKLGDEVVDGSKVRDNSLTGADINQSTLTAVRASNITSLALSGDATCSPVLPLPAGVSSERTSEGVCRITFPTSQTSCASTATIHLHLAPNDILIAGERTAYVSNVSTTPNILVVVTSFKGTKSDLPFDLVQAC